MPHIFRTHMTVPKKMTAKEMFQTAEVSVPVVFSI